MSKSLSNAEYHADERLGRSTAWKLITSCPAVVAHEMAYPRPTDSLALIMGSCTHAATLEPVLLDKQFAIKPEEIDGKSSRTNHYKEVFESMQLRNPNIQWLNRSDYRTCVDMAESAREHPLLKTYLSDQETMIEQTGFFECKGVQCKVRPDLYNPGAGVVIDIKTTQDASEQGFRKSIRRFGYAFQAAWYLNALRILGLKPKQFVFLCVEKTPPYLTAAYEISTAEVERELIRVHDACDTYKKCMDTGIWPGYGDEIKTLTLGNFATNGLLSISQTAEHFNVSRTWVYRMIKTHKIPTFARGKRKMLDMTDFKNAMRWDAGGGRNGKTT